MLTYTKADGSTRERQLTIYSRNLLDGRTHSLNAREPGNRITKQFLLSGISRLEPQNHTNQRVLQSPSDILAWLEQWVPAKTPERNTARASSKSPAASTDPARRPGPDPATSTPTEAAVQSHPAAATTPLTLRDLLPPGALGFAVVDLETTGVSRNCRIIEIALVRLDAKGRITEEWETLVDPGIAIPNAHVHGITDALVQGAPSFEGIAGLLAAKLHQHVLVAHNLRGFDRPILDAHFSAVEGLDLHLGDGVDTMPSPKMKLVELCSRHGVVLDDSVAHTAIGDTRALARALQNGMAHLKPAQAAVAVAQNNRLAIPARHLTRAMASATPKASRWQERRLVLEVGQVFITTSPPSMKTDTEIKRAEAHGIRLGLTYRKVSSIPKRNSPAFLLSTSLNLSSRKMQDARELGIPVVLCNDLLRTELGSAVKAWVFHNDGP